MLSLEYIAGLFDGEGMVRIATPGFNRDGNLTPCGVGARKTPSFAVHVKIGLVHLPILLAIKDSFGGFVTSEKYLTPVSRQKRIMFKWHAHARLAGEFLSAIQPFAIIKRAQIDIAIELQEHIEAHKHMMNRWATKEQIEPVLAHRYTLLAKMDALKEFNHDGLSVGNGSATTMLSA